MKYTKELLEDILQEGQATLLGNYERFNQRMYVEFRCKCGKDTSKRFEMLNKYRVPYCEECSKKVYLERQNKTILKKYGVKNVFQNDEIKEKIKKIYQENFGGHPKRDKGVQEKWKQTCLEKYGGHPNQNKEVQAKAEKNSFKHRDYVMPSGKVVKIQGYEDEALNELLQYYDESEITLGRANIPTFKYQCSEGISRVYYPDFYIEIANTVLEIKSDWTLKLKTCRLEEKAKAVKEAGYEFEVWVYDSQKKNKRVLNF